MSEFLYAFTAGSRPALLTDPDAWTDADRDVAADHFDYLQRGLADGVVQLAGRSQDWRGPAIVIIEAADAASALEFMNDDPFVATGLFGASLHPFRTALRAD